MSKRDATFCDKCGRECSQVASGNHPESYELTIQSYDWTRDRGTPLEVDGAPFRRLDLCFGCFVALGILWTNKGPARV